MDDDQWRTHGNNGTVFEMPLGGTLTTLHSMDPAAAIPIDR